MSTKFLSPGWRMPRNANQSKQSNYSLDFDGSSLTGVEVGTLDFLNSSASDFTISMWVKPTSRDRGMPFTAGPTNWIYIYYFPVGSYNEFRYKIRGSATQSTIPNLTSENEITPNKWYHITLTSEGTVAKFYLNGDLLHTGVSGTSYLNSGDNVMIGKWGYTANYEFHGLINSASIFDYALSASQVTTLWGGGTEVSNPMALPRTPIAYYPLGESAGGFVGGSGTWLTENNAIGDYVFDFNNSQDINCGNNSALQMDRVFTMSCWINTTSTSRGSIMGTYISNGYYIDLMASGTVQGGYHSTGSHFLRPSSSTVNDGNWHHICYVISGTATDGSDLNVYVDGQLNNGSFTYSGTPSGAVTTNPFKINLSGYSGRYTGETSNVQLFNTALSGPEVETLYNYGSPIQTLANIPQSSNLKAWYKLDASEIYNSTSTEWSVDNNQNPSAYPSSLDFSSDYIDCGSPSSLDFERTDAFSISAWVKRVGSGSYQSIIYKANNNSPYNGYAFYIDNNNKVGFNITINYNSSNYFGKVCTSVLNTDWNNVLITYNGNSNVSGLNIYINGSLQTVTTVGTSSDLTGTLSNSIPFNIGARNNTDVFLDGKLSNVQIFNTVLPETGSNSIETLYNNGTPLADMSSFSSLVSWWKLDNTTTGIEDSKGTNNGTNNGATEYPGFVNVLAGDSTGMSQSNLVQSNLQTVAPYSKYAMGFDGTDYIDCGTNPFDQTTGDITLSAWVKKTSGTGYQPIISATQGGGNSSTYFSLQFSGTNSLSLFWDGVASGDLYAIPSSEFTVVNGNWYLINFVRTGTVGTFYVNGNLVSTSTKTYNNFTYNDRPNVFLGGWNFSSLSLNGELSNASMWNAALTSAQIREIYNEGLPSDLNSHSAYSNLVSWWQLGENSSYVGGAINPWTFADEKGTNNGLSPNLPETALTNGVGTTANGVSSGMSEGSLVGDAPYSTANALSSGMAVTSRGTDVPPTP